MIRYRLDDLGWLQFENLVQVILKERLGLAVQSWGGSGDHGRDAFFRGRLRFPDKKVLTDGPFLFQVKFVEAANAAGAKPSPALLSAVHKEVEAITRRLQSRGPLDKLYKTLKHYVLLTNAPLSGENRAEVERLLVALMPGCTVHSLSGRDVCDLLNLCPNIRSSFPQILSLRDLDTLLRSIVKRSVLERSRAAIEEARELLPVFVPTLAYQKAFESVSKHHFLMLEGPPEVGKTAIARVISIAQILRGWEAIECRQPDDFFDLYDARKRQVFIADDAFGKTEYEPDRVLKWEPDLSKVLLRVDRRHWFLWTSRKHILERARRKMDTRGRATRFPEPAEVSVDASLLTKKEKSLILYRHAKAAHLNPHVKSIVRQNAALIVNQEAFTPERIRRFVNEDVKTLASVESDDPQARSRVVQLLHSAIENPTKQMRLSYETLAPPHRWLLISLLEGGYGCASSKLKELYEKHCPEGLKRPYETVIEELKEAFFRAREIPSFEFSDGAVKRVTKTYIQWIHPSYRDLVIEELAADSVLKREFLKKSGLEGLKLAVSDTGGRTGARRFPLVETSEEWDILHSRCLELSSQVGVDTAELLEILRNAAEEASRDKRKRLSGIISEVCGVLKKLWDAGLKFDLDQLGSYCRSSVVAEPLPAVPFLERIWTSTLSAVERSLSKDEVVLLRDPEDLRKWFNLMRLSRDNEPRFLHKIGFPEKFEATFTLVLEQLESDMLGDLDNEGEYAEASANAKVLATDIGALSELAGYDPAKIGDLCSRLENYAESATDKAQRIRESREADDPNPPNDDDDREWESDVDLRFDIDSLFVDL